MCPHLKKVIDSFESSFQDKCIIPLELEIVWLTKAIAQYNAKVGGVEFDEDTHSFINEISQDTADVLALIMRVLYQERETSKVNKRVSIVTKELSIDGTNGAKVAAREELEYWRAKLSYKLNELIPTAYN